MQRERLRGAGSLSGRAGVAMLLCLLCAGCTTRLQKHSVALSNATAPVVDQAEAAYRAAVELHDERTDYEAAAAFDKPPVYNPRTIQPLLSSKDIDVRLAVLTAFQLYVKSLVELTQGMDSAALDAASASVGGSLQGMGNTVAPVFGGALGMVPVAPPAPATQTATGTGIDTSPVSPAVRNGMSTAVNALGQYLVSKKIKSQLPGILKDMDTTVETLCEVLEKDLDILENQETIDFNLILNQQTLFIRESATNGLSGQDRREQIMKLPGIVRQWRTTDAQLVELRRAIVRLALTHHAFATEAQGNNPEALKDKIGDLESAGNDLGKFYSSLPSQ